jgi:hypothetical protein
MAKKLDVQQTLFDLYRAHHQELTEPAKKDLTKISTFIHGYHTALQYTLTLEQALQIAEKEDLHSQRSEILRAMKSIYDWTISPTPENLNNLLERVAETRGDSFNGIYVFWERYAPVLLDFGPILLRYQFDDTLERTKTKKDLKNISDIIFAHPDKKLQDETLSKLAEWEKRTNA